MTVHTDAVEGVDHDSTVSTATQKLQSFVTAVTDALDDTVVEETGEELVETVDHLVTRVDQLEQENDRLSEQVDTLTGRVDHLEQKVDTLDDDVTDLKLHTAKERSELASRVSTLEEESQDGGQNLQSDGETPTEGEKKVMPDAETHLEDVLRLPHEVADESLTPNQQRAVSVARDLKDYADYNGSYDHYSLTSTTLRKVLTAQSDDDTGTHPETVKRVRDFLDDFGETEVEVVEDDGGKHRLVFAKTLVKRIEKWKDAKSDPNHTVVTGEPAGGGVTA